MDSTHAIGLILVGISAALLASHWQQWRDLRRTPARNLRQRKFAQRQLRRRSLASSLVGLIGVALTVYRQVPPTSLGISVYLFGLILATCWILCLGMIDLLAMRQFQQREQIDHIAAELRRAKLGAGSQKSVKT